MVIDEAHCFFHAQSPCLKYLTCQTGKGFLNFHMAEIDALLYFSHEKHGETLSSTLKRASQKSTGYLRLFQIRTGTSGFVA